MRVHLIRLLVVASLVVLAWQGIRGIRVYRFEVAAYLASPHVVPMPADSGQLRLQVVSFPSRDGARIRGWLASPRNGAVVVITHGSEADRSARLADARPLIRAGYGVLLFDWPGQGESGGTVTWGRTERAALLGAMDFVAGQSGVDPERIGLLGFSDGGYIAAQVASRESGFRAIVLEATPADLREQTRAQYVDRGPVAQTAALLALRLHGPDPNQLRALDAVRAIAPRPLLLVSGLNDRTVPPDEARQLYAAAGFPKRLVLIPGAGHGDYGTVWGSRFDTVLVNFFNEAFPAQAPAAGRRLNRARVQ